MQSSYWGYWLVVLGVAIIGLSVTVNGLTTTTTENTYGIKEINDISLMESVDWAYFRDYNELKIDKEKYQEIVVRAISEIMTGNDTYTINIYGLYEAPPKASVEVITKSGGQDIVVRSDAIIQILAEEMDFS